MVRDFDHICRAVLDMFVYRHDTTICLIYRHVYIKKINTKSAQNPHKTMSTRIYILNTHEAWLQTKDTETLLHGWYDVWTQVSIIPAHWPRLLHNNSKFVDIHTADRYLLFIKRGQKLIRAMPIFSSEFFSIDFAL